MVEPSILKKKQRPEPGCMTKEEVEEAEGERTRKKDERIRGTMDAGEVGR